MSTIKDKAKPSRKSNSIDYEAIYKFLTVVCLGYFMLVYVDFFLLFSHIVPVTLLFLSIGLLALHLYFKHNTMLIASFVCTCMCIATTYIFVL
ncbi:MAG: hypothetical protein ATN34_00075 [Epulopiscium sp. Nele67-Bin002]|nr:MAG: hypothetical protein BEN18_08570 [Epulopiscium sp. Nuni2H_MBin001]OON90947.1 MAG: hypothetical protein ATN33_01955 [Epulopiscium sp. Nele67-Bin001]OON91594.1 MAG: hypothetical protein ATN34_00075 [Epulopiscium sp. Nele67-Bin002]